MQGQTTGPASPSRSENCVLRPHWSLFSRERVTTPQRLLAYVTVFLQLILSACAQAPVAAPRATLAAGAAIPVPTKPAEAPAPNPSPAFSPAIASLSPLASPPASPAVPASPSPAAVAAAPPTAIPRSGNDKDLILATTTSTQDSGLLDVLVPMFQQQSGYKVKTVAVGTGAALALGARGEADVVLVHAPASEVQWMQQGNGTQRLLVMHNDFLIVGPDRRPSPHQRRHVGARCNEENRRGLAPFVSRGDNSGHQPIRARRLATGEHHPQRSALVRRERDGHGPDADHR